MNGDNQAVHSRSSLHYGWIVIAVTFLVMLVVAGTRSMPGMLMVPFEEQFGWSRAGVSSAVSINLFLYGLLGPFAAAWMERFGIRRTMLAALALLGAGIALTTVMTSLWHLDLLWGIVVGVGSGALANVLGVTVANRWFVRRKGLVVGLLTASAATGQLLFLPLLAQVTVEWGWKFAAWTAVVAIACLIPLVGGLMRNRPSDVGLTPYGAEQYVEPPAFTGNPFVAPIRMLGSVARTGPFWLLAGTFFFCGFSTNGLIGTHLIAACGEYGIPEVTAAGLLALMGVFDLVGTTLSGWLSDRFDSRWLLFWYYGLRGLSLFFLPDAFQLGYSGLTIFAVFYGLDWIATVPPTVKLTADIYGKEKAGIVFGWIVAAHQLGAAAASSATAVMFEYFGSYGIPFVSAGGICLLAAVMAVRIRRVRTAMP